MKHLDEGELRRMLDEPGAVSAEQQSHAASCSACRALADEIARNAQLAARLAGGEPFVDARAAYSRMQDRMQERHAALAWRPFATCAAAAAFILALFVTPLGGYARSFLTIFEPQQFQPIEVSRADLRDLHLLPQADDVGAQRVVRKSERTKYASITAAQQHVPFAISRPSALPAHFGTVHEFAAMTPGEMTFTFSAAKARAFENRSHKALPPMPAGLDGTVVRLQTGYVFRAHYEGGNNAYFDVLEVQAPRVTSSGASLETLERYLLAMPNVSPRLAAQIRALGDVSNTLPVPVAIDKQSAHNVTVQGVKGLAIGDNTGLGAGVMWEKNGIVYLVAGPVSMNDAMVVADGLR